MFSPQSIARSSIYEPYLDGLRGIAILMVLAFHASLELQGKSIFLNFSQVIECLSRGVQFFFVISAFTLFRSQQKRSEENWPILAFYLRRAFRILPLWWIVAILNYVFFNFNNHSASDSFATAFFLFGFMENGWNICTTPVGWSLFIEESFYWTFPFWFAKIRSISWSVFALLASVGVAILWLKAAAWVGLTEANHFPSVFPLANYYAFFIGIFLFFVDLQKWNLKIPPFILDFCALTGFVGIFYLDRIAGTFALIPLFVSASCPQTLFGKLTRMKWLGSFGVCCYSIYLLHPIVTIVTAGRRVELLRYTHLTDKPIELQLVVWFTCFSILSLTVGLISFEFIEKPFVRLGRKVTRGFTKSI